MQLFMVVANGRILLVRAPSAEAADKMVHKRLQLQPKKKIGITPLSVEGEAEIVVTLVPRE
jgi:hypothetical protein